MMNKLNNIGLSPDAVRRVVPSKSLVINSERICQPLTGSFHLSSEQASQQFAIQLGEIIAAPLVLTFAGEIGTGKTTIIRALLKSLGVTAAVKSPTFSLVESYELITMQVHHFDLYRIHDETELDYIGFRDYFDKRALCCIEWPERAPNYTKGADLSFTLVKQGNGRDMQAKALSDEGSRLLSCLLTK